MGVKYYKEKPKSGRYVFVSKFSYILPNGEKVYVSAICDEKPGYEFFPIIGAYVHKADAEKGIYIEESEFHRVRGGNK